jgi:hypothetical protein
MKTDNHVTVFSELLPVGMGSGYTSDESRLEQRGEPSRRISLEKVKESISQFSSLMSQILSSMPQADKGFQVEEVQVHAFIDVEGGIQLLGAKFGSTVEGGLKFVWKRQD